MYPGRRDSKPGFPVPKTSNWAALPAVEREYYLQPTEAVARGLIGKVLVHRTREGLAAGIIVETEAYLHGDPGSHAFRGPTARNQPMFGAPGTSYVYQIYGVHFCLNVVCQAEGVPEAVLIRALEPVVGLKLMARRRGVSVMKDLCSGPAKLAQALGVGLRHNRLDLTHPPLWIAETGSKPEVATGRRIGLAPHRGAEAHLRFALTGSPYLSRRISS